MRALLGVSDKSGLTEFARGLRECGVDLIATDGTRRVLDADGIPATSVTEVSGVGSMLDGRVKTLHPAIHGGILARRDRPEHLTELSEHGFAPIDIVCVSLYPFAQTVAAGADDDACIENIDVGGPTMIRAAAKNWAAVTVVVNPAQYGGVLDELRRDGRTSPTTRRRLAAEAFAHVAAYDTAVADWFAGREASNDLPAVFTIGGPRIHPLRYGENPHQRGALYALGGPGGGLAHATQGQGAALSFTNWLDLDAARRLVSDFTVPAAAVIKHTNPCGFATGQDIAAAYERAHACDPRAAFGGIVGLNRPLTRATAEALASTFLEAVVAPAIDPDAAEVLASRPRLRTLAVPRPSCAQQLDVRSIDGGLLVQTADDISTDPSRMTVPTRRQPSPAQWDDLLVALQVCRHVKSNAVVIVANGAAVGVGAGQMSRVEAAELAVARAGGAAAGAVAASDAFFPMPDGVEVLARAGVAAIIQPGGSRKDSEAIAAADGAGVAMVMSGDRHFRH